MKYTGFDSHIDENGVLKNNFGIEDKDRLDQVERDITSYKEAILKDNPVKGKFDLKHLQDIHKYLFGDIYPFAGKIRDGYLQKGERDFTMGYRIVPEAEKLFTKLKNEQFLRNIESNKIAGRLAYYMGEINAIHPFREGNGRTQRIFITQLAKEAGYELDFGHVNQQEMINASIQAHKLNYIPLENLIKQGLSPSLTKQTDPKMRYEQLKKEILESKARDTEIKTTDKEFNA